MLVTSAGDAGDVAFCMAVVKHIPNGPHAFLIEEKDEYTAQRNRQDSERLLNLCRPLVEAQPYISECRMIGPGDAPDWHSGGFRKAGLHDPCRTLLSAHLRHLNMVTRMNLGVDANEPWLTVEPSRETGGMVVINRTGRYQNHLFPWQKIVDLYRGRIIFVGLPHEHRTFCDQFGFVSYRETRNLLDLAQLIAGSALFIGNQSVANAIAEGLKLTAIQETCSHIPDCVFKRPNIQHVSDGNCTLPGFDGAASVLVSHERDTSGIPIHTTPPGDWRLPGLPPQANFSGLVNLCKDNRLTPPSGLSIEDWIKRENAMRVPHFFFGGTRNYSMVDTAKRNAGF